MFLRKPKISYTFLVVCAVNLLATSGDVTISWTSPVYSKLYSNDSSVNPLEEPITEEQDSWIGSLLNIGAMLGTFPYGYLADRFGRKATLLSIALPHFVAYLAMAFAQNVYIIYFGRFLGGLAVGGGYTLLPMYIAEVSEDSNRGMFGVTLGIFWSIGNFLPYAIGPFLSFKTFNFILASLPVIFFVIFLFIGTETPYHLIAEKKIEEAEKVLMLLRSASKKEVEAEILKIQKILNREDTHGNWKDIISNAGLRKALLISLTLISFQQLCGCNSLTFYLQPIVESSNASLSSDIASVFLGFCCLVFSCLVPFVIERFGRKALTIFSAFGCSIFLSILGGYFYVSNSTDFDTSSVAWIPIVSLVVELFMFQIGLNITPWTISSELFPKNVKHISATTVSTTCWLMSFLVTKYFNDMSRLLTDAGLFWFYATMAFSCGIFTFLCVPETRGKSFGDIQDLLRRRTSFVLDTLEIDSKEKVDIEKSAVV